MLSYSLFKEFENLISNHSEIQKRVRVLYSPEQDTVENSNRVVNGWFRGYRVDTVNDYIINWLQEFLDGMVDVEIKSLYGDLLMELVQSSKAFADSLICVLTEKEVR